MQVTGNNTLTPHKSIRLTMDGLSFFQAGAWNNIAFSAHDKQLEQATARCMCQKELWENATNTQIWVQNQYTTVVPYGLFNNENALKAFKLHFPEANHTDFVVFWQHIQAFQLTLLFAVPAAQYKLINRLFGATKWEHHAAQTIEHSLRQSRIKGEKQVWVTAYNQHMHLVVANNGQLAFSNHFPINSQTDAVYFCANVYEQFALSQQQTPLYIANDPTLHNTLKKYITHCYLTN